MQQKTVVVTFFKANEEMQRFIAADLRITDGDVYEHGMRSEDHVRRYVGLLKEMVGTLREDH